MRRKRKNKHLIVKPILILVIFMIVIGTGYSYLSLVLKIGGHVAGSMNEQSYTLIPGSYPNLKVTVSRNNTWQENGLYKYQYSLHVTNIGQERIDNFKLIIDFLHDIDSVSIPNYEDNISAKRLTVTDINYILESQQSLNVDFILSSISSAQMLRSIKIEVATSGNEVTLDKFNVAFNITNGWGNYTYQYDVILTNKTGSHIIYWQLNITLPSGTTYVNGWNAVYSYTNDLLVIKNEKYNGKLNNGASTTIGLQLSTNIINFIPSAISVIVR
jgi:hypothetical protein